MVGKEYLENDWIKDIIGNADIASFVSGFLMLLYAGYIFIFSEEHTVTVFFWIGFVSLGVSFWAENIQYKLVPHVITLCLNLWFTLAICYLVLSHFSAILTVMDNSLEEGPELVYGLIWLSFFIISVAVVSFYHLSISIIIFLMIRDKSNPKKWKWFRVFLDNKKILF